MKIKIYVDTCILSRIVDRKMTREVQMSIEKIWELETVLLMTSIKTLEEFKNTPNEELRNKFEKIYEITEKTPAQPTMSYGNIRFGGFIGGGSTQSPVLTQLKRIFKDENDAYHIYKAFEAYCHFFLTLDKSTILNRAKSKQRELKILLGNMELVDPEYLCERLG